MFSTRTFAVCNQPPFFILFYSLLLANDRYFSSLRTVARFTGNTKELGWDCFRFVVESILLVYFGLRRPVPLIILLISKDD